MISTAARWTKVREIFFAALDCDPQARASLLCGACAGDESLQQEVQRLLDLDARPASFLDRPALEGTSLLASLSCGPAAPAFTPQLQPGDVLGGRFHIIALIGAGGMGEVYEARDEVLGEVIAIKIIRPGVEPIETLAARLRREALFARRVTHSSVCRVHDVIRHTHADGREVLALTMERLRGDTLARRLDGGPLSLAEALDIAGQIAGGLDAAHAEGVLHRDVKPDNIILEPREGRAGRAVLTDFGLAFTTTLTSGGERMTMTGMLAGTPAYMAPEQLRGEPSSARSDLYAFALVVREMLLIATPAASAVQRQALQRALDHDPHQRFASARDFVDALAIPDPPLLPAVPSRTRHRIGLISVGVLVALVALLIFGLRFYQQRTPQVAAASQLLLTDMVNGTQDRELDGATEVLRSQLAQSPHFELLGRDRLTAALTQMRRAPDAAFEPEVAREIAMREGVPLVVYSSLTRLGQDYVLSVKLELVGSRPSVVRDTWTRNFTASAKRTLFEAMHDAAVWIRQMSGEIPSELDDQDRTPAETTTSSWEALRLFARANALSAAGRNEDAVLVLNEAVRVDAEFAMAYTRLGDLLISLKRDRDGYAAWQRAIALAEQRQLTSRETLRIRGQHFEDMGNLAEAERAYRTYAVHYPNDFYAPFFLGSVLVEADRAQEAVAWFDTATRLRPSAMSAWVHLSLAHLDLGHAQEASASIAQVDALSKAWGQWLQALATFSRGEVSAALALLEPLRAGDDQQWRSRVSTIRASWLSELGQDADAVAELQSGLAFDTARGLRDREADKWLALADLHLRAGQRDAADVDAQKALEVATSAHRLAVAGVLAVRAGDLARARARLTEFESYPDVPKSAAFRERLRGEILLAEGDAAGATRVFTQVIAAAPRREDRISLARALVRIGDTAAAERALRETVSHPVRLYMGPEPRLPGLWRQAIVELIALVERRDPAAAAALRSQYRGVLSASTTTH